MIAMGKNNEAEASAATPSEVSATILMYKVYDDLVGSTDSTFF